MTRDALLKASIDEFRDRLNNCEVWETERHYTSTGYCYIVKKNPKPISAAIHYNRSFDTNENVGKYESNDIAINTREEIPLDSILTYGEFTFAITAQGNFNETMKQYHYSAQAAFKAISDKFLITTEEEIDGHIGSNSLEILMPLDFDFPVVPSYYAATNTKSYIMVDVTESEALSSIVQRDGEIWQYKKDSVKFSFVNLSTKEALEQQLKLQEFSLDPNARFGINKIGTLKDENFFQLSFNWKSLTYSFEFEVNYYLKAERKEGDALKIREALFQNLESA